MTLTLSMLLWVCPLAFLAGFIDSVAGGGGLISLPAYYLAGLPPTLAAGTNKLSACLGTTASVFRYHKSGRINFKAALPAALLALPGSYLGTQLLLIIPEQTVRVMVIAALPLVAVVVLFKKNGLSRQTPLKAGLFIPVCALIGLAVGFYDGLVGPGTGTFLILAMTLLMGMDAVDASGSAKIVNLASNAASLITLLVNGSVFFALGLPAAVFAIAGNTLGANMTIRRGAGFVRIMLLVILALLLAKMVFDVIT